MKSVLNESQIEQIADTVNRSNISADLKEDLIDHLCCIVEDEMSKGKEFETACRTALQRVCPNGLDEIQNETVFLLSSKSRKRLNLTMYVSGFVAITGILTMIIRKMLHLPFSDLLFSIAFFVAVLLFLPVSSVRLLISKSRKVLNRMLNVSGFVSISGLLVTVVLKALHVPGAPFTLLATALVVVYLFLPTIFVFLLKQTHDKKRKSVIFGFIGALFLLLSGVFIFFHWPGVFLLLLMAVVCFYITMFPVFSFKSSKKLQ